jgi:hypothetical protein
MTEPEDRLDRIATSAVASWSTLTDFEKELLGKRPADGTSRGWMVLNAVMDGFRGNVTPDDVPADLRDLIPEPFDNDSRTISKEHKISLAKWVDKNFAKGFYKDFLFSLEPKYRRLRVLPIINKGGAKDEWAEIFQAADSQFRLIQESRDRNYNVPYTITGVQESWDDYAKNTLYPYLQKNASDTFKKELELLGGVDLLRTLIADGDS